MAEAGYISEGICYRWNVKKLFKAVEGLEPFQYTVSQVNLKHCFWFETLPNVEEVLQHFQQVQAADLTYPIILAPDGTILDGIHRIVKARLAGQEYVQAVQLKTLPEADQQYQVD